MSVFGESYDSNFGPNEIIKFFTNSDVSLWDMPMQVIELMNYGASFKHLLKFLDP